MDTNKKRHARLLSYIAEHEAAEVAELSTWLSASIPTVRRDLNWLAELGLVERIHGGARRPGFGNMKNMPRLPERNFGTDRCTKRKQAIARFAASLCADGETVIINGGTTTLLMADFLEKHNLNILTNSFLMARRLLATSVNDVVLTGGTIYRPQNVIATPFEHDAARDYYADKMFMSVHAVSEHGFMEIDPLLVRAEQCLMKRAEKLIILADSSKFERAAHLRLCEFSRVHCVITDANAPFERIRSLEKAGVRVVIVEEDEN